MGCDIHLFGEKLVKPKWWQIWKKRKWDTIDAWEYDEYYDKNMVPREKGIYTSGRNYNLFCALCGVRSFQFIGNPSKISEPKGLPDDCCHEIKCESDYYGSDGHSHSWNTLKELEDFDWSPYGITVEDFKNEVFPKLRAASSNPNHVRIVYFFDN